MSPYKAFLQILVYFLSRITTAAPSPLLPICYCYYIYLKPPLPYYPHDYHHHTTVIIHQNCIAPSQCYLSLKYYLQYNNYRLSIVQQHICLSASYAIGSCNREKGKGIGGNENLESVKITYTFINFLFLRFFFEGAWRFLSPHVCLCVKEKR